MPKHLEPSEMGLLSHIRALRKHLIRYFGIFAVFLLCVLIFMEDIIKFLRTPYTHFQHSHGKNEQLLSTGLFEVVTMNLQICALVAGILSLPFLIREIWSFVAPGLYSHEKKFAKPITMASVVMFYLGIAFGFFVVIPFFIQSTLEWAQPYAIINLTVENYFSSLFLMVMIFGIIFEVPVVLSLLGTIGIINSKMLTKNRKIAFLMSFIIGAILSPPDVISQIVVSLPLYGMIELSIFCIRYLEKNRLQHSKGENL